MWRLIWISFNLGLRLSFFADAKDIVQCPPGCYCDEQKTELIPEGVGLRINCHPTISGSLNFSLLPSNTITLDLAKFGLITLPRDAFASAPYLQQLDLQNNGISSIDPKTFDSLSNLRVLDLSYNSLENIVRPLFRGLKKLERLKLNGNKIETIEPGAFDDLSSLVKIELAENKLSCDCNLEWFLDWLATRQNLLTNPSKTKCALPIYMVDIPIRKVSKEALKCTENYQKRPLSTIALDPSEHQVVFEGDSIKLSCKVQIASTQKVLWLMKGRPLEQNDGDNILVTTNLLPGDIVEAIVSIKNIKSHLSGDWTCIVGPQDDSILKGSSSWTSAPFQKSVNVLVITSETKLCGPTITETARGKYRWGVSVGGHTVQQQCQNNRLQPTRGFGFVYNLCKENGEWAASINATQCAYTSPVTETLHKFASMNTSFDTVTLMESARHFLNYTENPHHFQDPLDVVFFSKAVQNYLPYLKRNSDIGHYMMKMLENILSIEPSLMVMAQRHDQATKRLLDLLDNITSTIPTFEHNGDNIALRGQPLKPIHFEGITCTWYLVASLESQKARKIFFCNQGNKTMSSQGKLVLGSIVLPFSLIHQFTVNGLVTATTMTNLHLLLASFSNATLFPDNLDQLNYEPTFTSPVICSYFIGMPLFNLTDPVQITLKYPEFLDDLTAFTLIQPLWWSSSANGGYGTWVPEFCNLISAKSSLAVFSCHRLGCYSFRISKDADIQKEGAKIRFRSHHPVTYVSSVISIAVLVLSILVYISCNVSIRMSRKLKHALPNVWACMASLCFFFMAGINQTEHQVICRSIGITTHYLTLSTLIWLVFCTHIVYQKVTRQRQQTLRRAVGDDHPKQKSKRPLARFYTLGYGVGLVIITITASINLDYYTTSRHCFLKLGPFLGSVVLPAAVLLSLILGFAFSAYCVLLTAPSHVTEQMDVDLFRTGRPRRDRDTGSILSGSSINISDEERSSKATLHSHGLMIIMFLLTWFMAALAVTQSSPVVQKFPIEDLFSIFFSLSATTLSFFVFGYFCVLRRDVQRCWRQPVCLMRSRRPFSSDYDEQNEETTNLVNIFPNPNLMGPPAGGSDGKFNFGNNYSSNTFSDNLPPPHTYNFGPNSQPPAESDQAGPPGQQHPVNWGGVSHSGNNARKNSEDGSSDRVSLNNLNHLRRGYVAPVNSGCVSEADYAQLPNPIKYSSNQISYHLSSQQSSMSNQQGNLFHLQPHTSSPAGQSVPQFIDLSPLAPTQHIKKGNEPYGIISLDSRLGNGYTESSTIKVGQAFQTSSLEFNAVIVPKRGTSKLPLSHLMPSNKSASMPRRHPYYNQARHRTRRSGMNMTSDHEMDDARSKHSVGSSTCYSNKKLYQRPKRKPTNRKKRKTPNEEPFYNNVTRNHDESPDDNQFDSIERQRLPLHSSAPEFSEDQLSDHLLVSEDDSKNFLNTSAQLQQFMQADLMKRETSV